MTATWYALPERMPVNVAVRVRWAGWEGEAVYFRAKPSDRPAWLARVRAGKGYTFHPLPTDAMRRYGCGSEPDAMQPLGDAPHALGAPLPVHPHHTLRMGSIGGVAFDATAAAEEMQADRDRRDPDATALEALPWWREPSEVTYSPRGQIGEREAEGRVMRALYFLGGTEQPRAGRTNAAVLADLKHAFDLATRQDATASYVPRLNTTLRDSPANLLTAMEWFCELQLISDLAWKQAYALKQRAHNIPVSFVMIALEIGVDGRDGAQKAYTRGIARIAAIANTGTPSLDRIRTRTKEGNRAYALTR
ncbi:MAG: hypothetical protein ABL901_01120 [Hyphomicrobiaceae bacterium]